MALITRYLVITPTDEILTVKYNREAAFKSAAEYRKTGKTCGVWSEISILSAPQHTQEVCIIKFDDPIPGETGS